MNAQKRHIDLSLAAERTLLVWSVQHQHGTEHVVAVSETCARRIFAADHGLPVLALRRAAVRDTEAEILGAYYRQPRAA